jgi:hypothetical protein
MPNGSNDPAERAELEAFFRDLADALTDFANRHNMRLQKYYHDAPEWTFTFRHPQAGVSAIEVLRVGPELRRVDCCWWYDDYDKLTRFIRRHHGATVPRQAGNIQEELDVALSTILGWKFDDWGESHGGYKQWRRSYTKEQFLSLRNEYPELVR